MHVISYADVTSRKSYCENKARAFRVNPRLLPHINAERPMRRVTQEELILIAHIRHRAHLSTFVTIKR